MNNMKLNELGEKNLIIFDLDGTLIDSLEDVHISINQALKSYNFPQTTKNHVKNLLGIGGNAIVKSSINSENINLIDEINSYYLDRYEENLLKNTKLYSNVVDVLDYLKCKNIKLAICTNKSNRFTLKITEHLELNEYFDLIICGDTLPEKTIKYSNRIYNEILWKKKY